MKIKMKFKTKIVIWAIAIALLPLIFSYWIFIGDQLKTMDARIRTNIREAALSIAQTPIVQDKLYAKENDLVLQYYAQGLIQSFRDVDIIVIADMTGEKYSHLDIAQIGEIFIGEDKAQVLRDGESYYSLMEGSMGTTLRWFQPIVKNGQQVGFVMVGKYYDEIYQMRYTAKRRYAILFILAILISTTLAVWLAHRIKRAILFMEPEEIARLYLQKDSILNGVQEGIIALDSRHHMIEMNKNAQMIFKDFTPDELLDKIEEEISKHKTISFKELIVHDKHLFVNLQPIWQGDKYLGATVSLMDEERITQVAKEITGIEEVNRNLRATIHEFKNNMHVILGLLQLEEYSEAKKYVLKIQNAKQEESLKFAVVKDYYIRALLLSRSIIAKERKIQFDLSGDSNLMSEHGTIDSKDLVTILGNLLENAFEACLENNQEEKKIEVSLEEDETALTIKVRDNGIAIQPAIRDKIFELGVSSKGTKRGNGLYLLANRVAMYNGTVEINELGREGFVKQFVIILPKEYKDE